MGAIYGAIDVVIQFFRKGSQGLIAFTAQPAMTSGCSRCREIHTARGVSAGEKTNTNLVCMEYWCCWMLRSLRSCLFISEVLWVFPSPNCDDILFLWCIPRGNGMVKAWLQKLRTKALTSWWPLLLSLLGSVLAWHQVELGALLGHPSKRLETST